jgi:hypothetical protein
LWGCQFSSGAAHAWRHFPCKKGHASNLPREGTLLHLHLAGRDNKPYRSTPTLA